MKEEEKLETGKFIFEAILITQVKKNGISVVFESS